MKFKFLFFFVFLISQFSFCQTTYFVVEGQGLSLVTTAPQGSAPHLVSNNLKFSGSGDLSLSGSDIYVDADFDIGGGGFNVGSNTVIIGGNTSFSNGNLEIGSGTFESVGSFDASNSTLTFTGPGRLKLGGSATSFGSFTRGTGTVEYNGASQTVLNLNSSSGSCYNNLEISGTGTKTLSGTSKIYGDLILTSSDFNLNGKTLYLKENMSRTSGNLVASSSSNLTIDNSGTHNICSFSDNDITIKTTSSGGSVTTTGDIDCKRIYMLSGNKTFTIDGETVNLSSDFTLNTGVLNVTSGALNINSNTTNSALISGGKLQVDGGTVSIGNSTLADIDITSGGELEINGGTLNIADALDVTSGTYTQNGGIVNVKSYVGSSHGSSENKFDVAAGTVNLIGGTLNLLGQKQSSSYTAMTLATGVSITANSNHNTVISTNNTSSNDENMYLDINGKSLGSVTLNLSGHDLYTESDVGVKGTLTMNGGNIYTQSNTLTIGTSTTDKGSLSRTSGFVDGKLKRWFSGTNSGIASGLFPLCDASESFRFVKVEYQQSTGGTLLAEWMPSSMGYNYTGSPITTSCNGGFPITNVCTEGYWSMTPADGISNNETKNYNITLSANNILSFIDDCHLGIVKRNGNNPWQIAGTHVDNTGDMFNPSVQSQNAQGWSNWGFVGGNGSALPVELLSFHANCEDDAALLKWVTASEYNSQSFDIQRSSDLIDWIDVVNYPAAGNSTIELSYSYLDENRSFNEKYYRLIQRDIDGNEMIYGPVFLNCFAHQKYISTYPNPGFGDFTLLINDKDLKGACDLKIIDTKGSNVFSKELNLMTGINTFFIANSLAPGMYQIQIHQNSELKATIKHVIH